jgi:hypothetical protein
MLDWRLRSPEHPSADEEETAEDLVPARGPARPTAGSVPAYSLRFIIVVVLTFLDHTTMYLDISLYLDAQQRECI